MSVAGTNEKIFAKSILERFGQILDNKKIFRSESMNVSISVDNSVIDTDTNTELLFEVDSGNMAKLLVGQYTLLNILHEKPKNAIFVVVHYYKNYNSNRTLNNLTLINSEIYNNAGIRFTAFNKIEFEEFINQCINKEEFVKKLKARVQKTV